MKDFFISYTGVDTEYAVWVDYVLKNAGYSTFIQENDFGVGHSFVKKMQTGLTEAKRTIAILSPEYLKANYSEAEWMATWAKDPSGEQQLLILVRVKSVQPPGLLKPIVYIDLTNVDDEAEAERRLVDGIQSKINQSTEKKFSLFQKPRFPFRKKESRPSHTSKKETVVISPRYIDNKLGQLDRRIQFDHFSRKIPKEYSLKRGRNMGFIAHGPGHEWPESTSYRLNYLISKRINAFKLAPELKLDKEEREFDPEKPEEFLWEFLGDKLGVEQRNKREIKLRLEKADTCYIFARKVTTHEVREQNFLVNLLVAWQKIKLKPTSPSHFLLLICESNTNKTAQWCEQIEVLLNNSKLENALLPPLSPVNLEEDLNNWLAAHIEVENNKYLKDAIQKKAEDIKKSKINTMPMLELQNAFRNIFENH